MVQEMQELSWSLFFPPFIHRLYKNIINNKNRNIINKKINSSFRIYVLLVCSFLHKIQEDSQEYRVLPNFILLADTFFSQSWQYGNFPFLHTNPKLFERWDLLEKTGAVF